MKENPSKHKNMTVLSTETSVMREIIAVCPKCGGEVGLWSEEAETVCIFCEHRIYEKEKTVH